MRRKYLHRVEVYKNDNVDDSAGGYTLTETKLSDSWANVSTIPANKLTDYGLDQSKQSIEIRLRYRDDLNYHQEGLFFKYQGKDWFPQRIEDRNLDNHEIVILANGNG